MTETTTPAITPSNLFHILVRHRRNATLFFVLIMAIVVGMLLFWPWRFRSEAKLFVRVGRESVALDPTATTGQTVRLQVSRTHEIKTVVEIIQSRAMSEKVVDVVTPEKILSSFRPNWLAGLMTGISRQFDSLRYWLNPSSAGVASPNARDEAIELFEAMLDVSATRDTNVITVACIASSPTLAQEMVASLVNAYVTEHARFNRTAGSEEFFEAQSDVLHQRLRGSKEQLRDLKNEEGIVSIEAQLTLLETQKMEIEGEQLRVARELASTEASIKAGKIALESMDRLILAAREEGHDNRAADMMRSQLYDLEIRERELSKRYEEDHPLVRAVRHQLADLNEAFKKEDESRTQHSFQLNPNWQEMQLAALVDERTLASLQKTSNSLVQQHGELVAEIRKLNSYALKINELQQSVDLQQDAYRAYRENLEQARIDEALQTERITNVNTVQEATLSAKPEGPRKQLVASLGLLAALSGSVWIAWMCEMYDRRLKSAVDVKQTLSVPVLVSIPNERKQCVQV